MPNCAERETAIKSKIFKIYFDNDKCFICSDMIGYIIRIDITAENERRKPGLNKSFGFNKSKMRAAIDIELNPFVSRAVNFAIK